MKGVLVTGAGVDKTTGIDFPLANKLLPEVAHFISQEGKDFEITLRDCIPGLRFNFTRFINQEINAITSKDVSELRRIVESVQHAVSQIEDDGDLSKKRGTVIVKLFDKLMQIQQSSQIDDETFELIREAFGDDFTESDFVIDIHKMSLSETFKSILKVTLRESLSTQSNPIADAIASQLLNIEQLLIQKFLGFYNQTPSDCKSYVYIAWCLWGYLVTKQRNVVNNNQEQALPFYSTLPSTISAVTLNYTNFLEHCGLERVIYFHGGLAEYVRMDTRELLPIDNIETLDLCDFIKNNVVPNMDFSSENSEEHQHVIPSLVPPLKLKPILSQKYIDLWADAAKLLHEADKVVVVGYSFNNADEHFNDIVRNGGKADYVVIAPDATSEHFIKRMEKVFGISPSNLTTRAVDGHETKTTRGLTLISAMADEVDLNKLFG